MSSKEDPIIGMNSMSMKIDILKFKEETLKDFKNAQKEASDNLKVLNFEINEKIEGFEKRLNNYESQMLELTKLINSNKIIKEKINTLMEFKERVDISMFTEKIRLNNVIKDLNQNVTRIDKILQNSVIYPGVIGGVSKYKTFHDLIDYVLTECSFNSTFREKYILDFKGYKTKLDNIISSFNNQVNTLLDTTSDYTRTCVNECEERMKSIYNIYDDRLQDSRLENANYAIGLEKATEALKKELENLYVVKKELFEKVDNGISEVKNDNSRVVKIFTGYQKNFRVIQHKFTQLSDFIKDVRFQANLNKNVKRADYNQMSDLINFDKRKKPGFYDGVYDRNLIKKKFGSHLKDYIEGKITADQLFKKSQDLSKSVSVNKNNTQTLERSKTKNLILENNNLSIERRKSKNIFDGNNNLNFERRNNKNLTDQNNNASKSGEKKN